MLKCIRDARNFQIVTILIRKDSLLVNMNYLKLGTPIDKIENV